MTVEERQAKINAIMNEAREYAEGRWPEGKIEIDIDEIEDLARGVAEFVQRRITEEIALDQASQRAGNRLTCACGGTASYRGDHALRLATLVGRVEIRRAYFHCGSCGKGICPLDHAWRLGPSNTTPCAQELVAGLAGEVPFTLVPRVLKRMQHPLVLDVKTIEGIAQKVGKAIQADPCRIDTPAERPLAACADGVMLPTRSGYKEARCGVIYEADWNAGRTDAAERGLRKEFMGTLGSRDELMRTLCARAEARRSPATTYIAALGDGAPWIWEGFAKYMPYDRIDILDLYHASEHLNTVAKAMHGAGTAAATEWVAARQDELLERGPGPLLRTLQRWKPEEAEAIEVRRVELGYFTKNKRRMNYPTYLAMNLPIGSGAIEGACKNLITARFKRSGMRWNPDTAEPIIHLRAALLTDPECNLRRYLSPTMPA